MQVIHPTVQELTDIAANCFTVRGSALSELPPSSNLDGSLPGRVHQHMASNPTSLLNSVPLPAPLPLQTQDLLRMERILLDSLAWRVKMPTTYTFLHLYTQSTAAIRAAGGGQARQGVAAAVAPSAAQHTSDPLSGAVVAKAAYLIELALLDYGMLEFRPSEVAASALLLSESWSPQGAAVDEMQVISGAPAARWTMSTSSMHARARAHPLCLDTASMITMGSSA